ncbi:unnamed protein product [Blepharisma stoltei]|uniref:Uncharacterized protein n=1 Tax=Blepharisma stoltei TaxID=1481888 RepID=A0AAU9IKL2_9CILI|nr:unnamed protein product [Blepharisma stoltei]
MSLKSNNVKAENSRLKAEIKYLQLALKDIDKDIPLQDSYAPSSHSKILEINQSSASDENYLIQNSLREQTSEKYKDRKIKDSYQYKIYETEYHPRDKISVPTHFASFGNTREYYCKPEPHNLHEEMCEEFDYLEPENENNGSSMGSEALHNEFYKIKASVEKISNSLDSLDQYSSYKNKHANKEKIQGENEWNEIKDSFESYYSKENSIESKHESSRKLENYVVTSEKELKLLKEIEALRRENNYLRNKLSNSPKPKRQISKHLSQDKSRSTSISTLKPKPNLNYATESPSRIRSSRSKSPRLALAARTKSPTSKSPRHTTPTRLRHCRVCDHLLSKGYSTKYCSKHGESQEEKPDRSNS